MVVVVKGSSRNYEGPNSPEGNEVFSIAQGEGKHPIHFMRDRYCEVIVSSAVSWRKILVSRSERCEIVSCVILQCKTSSLFWYVCNKSGVLIFAQFITEQKKVRDRFNITLRKVSGERLTVLQVQNLNTSTINRLIASDQENYILNKRLSVPRT